MLIQNTSSMSQAPQPGRIASDRLTSDGRPIAVSPSSKHETPSGTSQSPEANQIKEAVGKFNEVMLQSKQNLEFSVDTDTKKPVIRLIDTATGDVIRQIPTEEMLSITRSIDHFQQGMLLKQKA